MRKLDLTGQKYGLLTVIHEVTLRNRIRYWLCQCECGNQKEVRQDHLKSGKIKSCGCLRKQTSHSIDLTNKRFGKLVAKHPTQEPKNGKILWFCECDCGNTVTVSSTYLTSGNTKSCGCSKEEINEVNLREKYDDKRVNNVVLPLFKDKTPRKDSSVGYRGVSKYYTHKSKEIRYRAWITVNGKRYYKSGLKLQKTLIIMDD